MSEQNTGVTVTLKAGRDFDAPWIVIHAESVADAKNQIDTGDFATLAERTVAAAEFFRAAHNVKGGLAANQGPVVGGGDSIPPQYRQDGQGNAWSQQGSQQAPPAFVPPQQPAPQQNDVLLPPQFCSHGEMTLRRAKPNSGKKWVAYMCPTPQGTPGQCRPVDAKTGKSWD